jgi:hypothetical protein
MENSGDESHPATPHGKNDSAEGLDLQNHGVVLCNKQDANSSSQVPDLKPYTAILQTLHTYVLFNGIRSETYLTINYRNWKKQVHELVHVQFLSQT